ncbi:hypothetical protein TRSC58_07344 [Trypanosoma rangeli SC58]|uniref:Uncharacterized protein n=1 Tax=Trypanosoma rangeli SC58 TaxID=429131 RepID=A0A061IS30_TRYRA|nr:hypothetical protein TRSC58_07344 [Trypanosoma rangeli SC58]
MALSTRRHDSTSQSKKKKRGLSHGSCFLFSFYSRAPSLPLSLSPPLFISLQTINGHSRCLLVAVHVCSRSWWVFARLPTLRRVTLLAAKKKKKNAEGEKKTIMWTTQQKCNKTEKKGEKGE